MGKMLSRPGLETDGAMPLAALRARLHPLSGEAGLAMRNLADLADLVDATALTPAAVLVGLVPRAHGWQVVLTRRVDTLRHHGGQVSLPGGRVDAADGDAVQAALREAREEIGLDSAEPIGLLDPIATITGFRVQPVVACLPPDFQARANPAEVAEVFEIPLELLHDATQRTQRSFEHAGRLRTVWEFAHRPQRIWGATAAILVNLAETLE